MTLSTLQNQAKLLITQKITLMVNRYVVTAGDSSEVVAFAEQKRIALKEQITFYTGEDKREVLFSLKARSVIDLGATYNVLDSAGTPIGTFRKDFARSLLRSTWHLDQPSVPTATGTERNLVVAILRRVWNLIPFTDFIPFAWPYHFDFATDGQQVLSVTKKFGIRDRYVVEIGDDRLDRRLVIAQAVGLDALQSR